MDSSLPGSSVHGISRQYWNGLPFPSPWDLPYPGIKPASPALAGRFFATEPPGNPCDHNKDQQEKEQLLSFPGNNTVNDKSSPLPYKRILLSLHAVHHGCNTLNGNSLLIPNKFIFAGEISGHLFI